jgi:hypothetical protein
MLGLALGGRPDPLELLRHPDRGDTRAAGGRLAAQVRCHGGQIVVVPAELDPRDVIGLGVGGHRAAEPVTNLVNSAGDGNGNPRCPDRNATTCALVCNFNTYALR